MVQESLGSSTRLSFKTLAGSTLENSASIFLPGTPDTKYPIEDTPLYSKELMNLENDQFRKKMVNSQRMHAVSLLQQISKQRL